MNPLDNRDIDDYQNYFPMPYRKYFSRYIFSEDEIYLTDDSLKKDPFTVILDGSGKIIFVEITGTAERALNGAILKTFLETVNET
jgi:hypothetical protein